MVGVEILELGERRVLFRLRAPESAGGAALANALRRSILDDVPTLAIDSVEVHENTTVTNDDLLAHKLGLIPLVSDAVAEFKMPPSASILSDAMTNLCDCETGCDKCSVVVTLNVRNDSEETRTLTSSDLVFHHPRVRPVPTATNEGVAFALLGKGQQVSLTARAVRGTPKQNAKWSPVVIAAFRPEARIMLDEAGIKAELNFNERRQLAEACPCRVLAYDDAKDQVSVARPDRCTLCLDCVDMAARLLATKDTSAEETKTTTHTIVGPSPMDIEDLGRVAPKKKTPLVRVAAETERFTFDVETTGCLSPATVLDSAIQALTDRLVRLHSTRCNLFPLLDDAQCASAVG